MADEGRIAELIIRLLRQELTRPDQEAFSAWLNGSSDKRTFVDTLTREEEIVAGLRIMKGMDKVAIRRKVQYLMDVEDLSPTRRPVRTIARYRFAAAVFVGFLVGWGIYEGVRKQKVPLTTMLSVSAGTIYQGKLPDGSTFFLNAGSTLHFPAVFKGSERRVELHGEGWFDVAKDADHPFIVVSDRQRVEVLGTAFDVCDYPDEPFRRTTVEKGRVHVRNLIGVTDSVSLTAGQEAQVNGDSAHMKILSGIHAAHASAWRRGYFNFDNLDIRAAVNKMARWYDKKVSLQHVTIGTLGSGDIQQDLTLPVLLKDLELPDLHFEIHNDTIVVKR